MRRSLFISSGTATAFLVLYNKCCIVSSFAPSGVPPKLKATVTSTALASMADTEKSNSNLQLKNDIEKLKRVLSKEYATFFAPMETQYYAKDVSFTDPMTSLSGVQSYQDNVDMLASRTFMGKVLFEDAGIVLHNVQGGDILEDGNIGEITTRWTLRLTAKILPWTPTARFSGISVYQVESTPTGKTGVTIKHQTDYWDSINIVPDSNGKYETVDKTTAIQDFLNQLAPGGFQAQAAAPELPYSLLRRGNGYEVRKYPGYTGVKLPYRRRDEGFGSLGAFAKGMSPLSPALMDVMKDDISDKFMMWPLTFTQPGDSEPPVNADAVEKAGEGQWRTMRVVTVPERVVAVKDFSDASMEPVVRKADRDLRELLDRDGLVPADGSEDLVRFAQYDAIFSMGKRRGEVWIDLSEEEGGHPFGN